MVLHQNLQLAGAPSAELDDDLGGTIAEVQPRQLMLDEALQLSGGDASGAAVEFFVRFAFLLQRPHHPSPLPGFERDLDAVARPPQAFFDGFVLDAGNLFQRAKWQPARLTTFANQHLPPQIAAPSAEALIVGHLLRVAPAGLLVRRVDEPRDSVLPPDAFHDQTLSLGIIGAEAPPPLDVLQLHGDAFAYAGAPPRRIRVLFGPRLATFWSFVPAQPRRSCSFAQPKSDQSLRFAWDFEVVHGLPLS